MIEPQLEMDDGSRLDGQMLSDLWIFRSVARLGSVTAAAERLRVTQSAVSQRILRLEARLNVQLFSRKRGRLFLSEAGSGLLIAMNSVSNVLNGALSHFDRARHRALVVSCMPSLATEWLVPRLEDFYSRNPDIELFIRAELVEASAERMEDEGIDILIQYSQASSSNLCELASLQEMIFPVCALTYRREKLDGIQRGYRLVRLHDVVPWLGGPKQFEWDQWTSEIARNRPERMEDRNFNLAHLAYHAALCGQGVAMGRAVLVNRLLAKDDLVAATSEPPVLGATYRILTNRDGGPRSPGSRFAGWLIDEMKTTQEQTLAMIAGDQWPPL